MEVKGERWSLAGDVCAEMRRGMSRVRKGLYECAKGCRTGQTDEQAVEHGRTQVAQAAVKSCVWVCAHGRQWETRPGGAKCWEQKCPGNWR